MAPPPKACDQCHRRRIKCGGEARLCEPCDKAGLECTYDKPVKRKGAPGKILTTLKQRHQDTSAATSTSHVPASSSCRPASTHQPSGSWSPAPSLFDSNLFECGSLLRLTGDEAEGPSLGGLDWMETLGGLAGVTGGYVGAGPVPLQSGAPTTNRDAPGPSIFPLPSAARIDFSNTYRRPPTLASPPHPSPPPQTPFESSRQLSFSVTTLPRLTLMSILTPSTLQPQIEAFFARMQPVLPIFDRPYVFDRIGRGDHLTNLDFAAMIIALSSYALMQLSDGSAEEVAERADQAKALMGEAAGLQCSAHLGQAPTLDTVLTSFFLFGTLFALNEHNAGFFRLREAITLAETLELHRPASYAGLNMQERGMRVRLFWILSVTERAFAVQRNHSITFRGVPGSSMALVGSSSLVGGPADDAVRGLQRLAHLFDFIDEGVVSCWNGICCPQTCATLTTERVVELDRGLSEDMPGGSPESARTPEGQSSDVQHADLLITQQWLRNRVWQLSVTHGLASDESPHPSLSPTFALEIAQITLHIYRSFSRSAVEGNGIGLAEKLHDIALSIILVINVSPGDLGRHDPLTAGRALLPELIAVLKDFKGGQHPFLQPVVDAWDRVFSA